jgi:transcriptional/translational regulatory protein YebC/TACO1
VSGHSKWSSIKHKKGAADAKRGKLFSKLSRAIIVAAKEGGGDPDANLALANAVEKARAASMPKDNIERAIARGAGADASSEAYDSVTYEGYGASGAALIVEALTDNRNRTAADVRFAFGKFTVPVEAVDEDTITLAAADGGAEDVREDGDTWLITCEPGDFPALRSALEDAEIPIDSAGLSLLPKTQVEVDAEQARTLLRLVDALEESDDVQDVYFNFDIPDAVLADA